MGNPRNCPTCKHIIPLRENINLLCPMCKATVMDIRAKAIVKSRENSISIVKASIRERQIPYMFKKFRGYNNKIKEA